MVTDVGEADVGVAGDQGGFSDVVDAWVGADGFIAAGRSDAADPELDRDEAFIARIVQTVAPEHVRVAAQNGQIGAAAPDAVVKAQARRRITVPGVQIDRQAQTRAFQPAPRARTGHGVGQQVLRHDRDEVRRPHPRHHHLIGQHLPRLAALNRLSQRIFQPGLLLRTEHGTVRSIQHLCFKQGWVRAAFCVKQHLT